MNIKPKLRVDASYDFKAAMELALLQMDFPYKTCLNCLNFKESNENCLLANQRPPARVIAFGCPKWEDKDGIPF